MNSPDKSPLSRSFLWSYLFNTGPFDYISLYESLLQPLYNPLWLTALKAPTKYNMYREMSYEALCALNLKYMYSIAV